MAVHIEQAVWDEWFEEDRGSDRITVVLHCDLPQPEAIALLSTAIDELTQEVMAEDFHAWEDMPRMRLIAPSPQGPCLVIEAGLDLHLLLGPLAERLAAAQVWGSLRLHEEVSPPLPGTDAIQDGFWECRVALAAEADPGEAEVLWVIDPEHLRSVIEIGVDWVTELFGGKLYGWTGAWWRTSESETALDLLQLQAEFSPDRGLSLTVVSGRSFRRFECQPWLGFVSLASGPIGSGPEHSEAEVLTGVMGELAGYASYGFVRRGMHPSLLSAAWATHVLHPERPESSLIRSPGQLRVEDSCPVGVFPAQLLRIGSARSISRSRWAVSTCDGAFLVVTRDWQAWAQPDERVLATAWGDLRLAVAEHAAASAS